MSREAERLLTAESPVSSNSHVEKTTESSTKGRRMVTGNGNGRDIPELRPCQHQVAGHLFEAGKAGSLVDDGGNFYKPLQPGPRGCRELAFYNRVFRSTSFQEHSEEDDGHPEWNRRRIHYKYVPRFFGTVEIGGQNLLILEDVCVGYSKPCVMDIKIGYRTWYNCADERYIKKARAKDAATTQASLGFKICGWQVYKHSLGKFWRASKFRCKSMSEREVLEAFLNFTDTEIGLNATDVLGGSCGAISQLLELRSWFQLQKEFHFYSSSVLILYEGDAACPEDLNVRVRMVDFAHTFYGQGSRDRNFFEGLGALVDWFQRAVEARAGSSHANWESYSAD